MPASIGWTDSNVAMGTNDCALIPEETAPLKILVGPRTEEAGVCLNLQEAARQPAVARKAARASVPNAKAQIIGVDKAVKAKIVKEAKTKVAKVAKAAKETKGKAVKEPKTNIVKKASAKMAKESSMDVEVKAEVVKQKRIKNEPTEPKIKQPKAKKATGAMRRRNQKVIAGQPTWSVPWTPQVDRVETTHRGPPSGADFRPRAWCSSKEELVSALPELTRCTNGVSWLQSEPPILFLEEGNLGTVVTKVGSHSLELRMTRTFNGVPADLNTPPAATPSTTKPPCDYLISRNVQPVDVKSHQNFSSRPKFIPTPREPRASHNQGSVAQPVPSTNMNLVPSHLAQPKYIEPESEYDIAFRRISSPNSYVIQGVYPSHAREAPAHYEVPMSFSGFVTPRGSRSPFSEGFRNSSVGRHSSTATSTSACSSLSPSPDMHKTRRCTCGTWRNIYCGVCDVTLQSEDDPCFQSKEGDLRYVPVTNLMQMSASHAYAADEESTVLSNTFACRATPHAELQPTHDTRLTAIILPPPSASTPSFASSSPSCGVQPHSRCSGYEGLSCIVCSPKTGMQLSQPAILSISPPAPGLVCAAPSPGLKSRQGLVERSAQVQDKSKRKLVNPLTIRIPRRVVPSQPAIPQGGHISLNSNIHVKVEDPAPASLYLTPASPHVPPHTQRNSTQMPQEVGTHIDQRIPSVLPPEVQVIIDAYVSGTPLIIITTKSMLEACWGISVPAECGYAYLGFFSVGEVLEERVSSPELDRSAPGRIVGQVEWRFKCVWGASGEEDADPTSSPGSPQPWWLPRPVTTDHSSGYANSNYPRQNPLDALRVPAHARSRSQSDHLDKSNARYRAARRQHPNAQYGLGTGARLGDRYWSILPEHVRGQLGTETGWDQGFGYECVPSGWWCERCGRVNYQALFRMRWCIGERCRAGAQTSVRAQGFATPLEVMRNPMLVMPTTHPVDSYPGEGRVRKTASTWADGMRTFVYAVREPDAAIPSTSTPNVNLSTTANTGSVVNVNPGPTTGVGVKHIFAGNMRSLQVEATELLFEIQKDVPLQRSVADPGPYFSFSVFSPAQGTGPPSTAVVPWDQVPSCVERAKDAMLFYARGYGEDRAFEINRLDIYAWVTSGSKKGPLALQCGKWPLVIMCLGSEAVISVVPKSGFDEPEVVQALASGSNVVGTSTALLGVGVDTDGLIPIDMDMNMEIDDADRDEDVFMAELGTEVEMDDADPLVARTEMEISTPQVPNSVPGAGKATFGAPKPKPRKLDISVTLLHGDAMILYGDDFEYSIKRTGTSILLIGTYVEGTGPVLMPVTLGRRATKS